LTGFATNSLDFSSNPKEKKMAFETKIERQNERDALTESELDGVVGGGAKNSANNATKDPPVRESISLSFSSIAWAY
jgi:hypothetical protein